jgi:hypothetical protein
LVAENLQAMRFESRSIDEGAVLRGKIKVYVVQAEFSTGAVERIKTSCIVDLVKPNMIGFDALAIDFNGVVAGPFDPRILALARNSDGVVGARRRSPNSSR